MPVKRKHKIHPQRFIEMYLFQNANPSRAFSAPAVGSATQCENPSQGAQIGKPVSDWVPGNEPVEVFVQGATTIKLFILPTTLECNFWSETCFQKKKPSFSCLIFPSKFCTRSKVRGTTGVAQVLTELIWPMFKMITSAHKIFTTRQTLSFETLREPRDKGRKKLLSLFKQHTNSALCWREKYSESLSFLTSHSLQDKKICIKKMKSMLEIVFC